MCCGRFIALMDFLDIYNTFVSGLLISWAGFRALGLAGFAPVLCFGCCFFCFASLVVLPLLSLPLLFFPALLRLFLG